jgi:DeoR/GlpR family transcriptional regulator of sugar metabolism
MAAGRHRRIESLLTAHGDCSVEMLAKELAVSPMTVRRDLRLLSERGRVLRTRGGAEPIDQVRFEFEFLKRAGLRLEAKQAIARVAADLVPDGASVILDSGTTTLELARQLRGRAGLTVITACLPIASALRYATGVRVLLLGGFLHRNSADLGGALTEMNLEQLRSDFAFLGADGIDLAGNAYNDSPELTRMLARMSACANATYVVADSTKFGRTALMRYGNLTSFRGFITDRGLGAARQESLRRAGVQLLLAPSYANHEILPEQPAAQPPA